MTIVEKKKNKDGITTYIVKKNMTDEQAEKRLLNKFVTASMINHILKDDADVYTDDGELLLRFRKNIIPNKHSESFYDNVIKFALTPTSNRGSATGSKSKNIYENPKIMTNIFGYFDRFSPIQKKKFRDAKIKLPLEVRDCRFNRDYPEQYKETLPLLHDIDRLYKKYVPTRYIKQNTKAKQTPFNIPGTSFTTVTTNVNFRTSIHTDKGDDVEGFGNLVVIEDGKYTGAETCFPQYGIGVDLRKGDILFMDVHKLHGNLPMTPVDKNARRLSIVCYLRENIWKRTKGKSVAFMKKHNELIRSVTNINKTPKHNPKHNKTHKHNKKHKHNKTHKH
jgi:hypothetical protein